VPRNEPSQSVHRDGKSSLKAFRHRSVLLTVELPSFITMKEEHGAVKIQLLRQGVSMDESRQSTYLMEV
jgi:hypothetical protein